jgi:GT2 family glycosyltransferase
VPVELSVVIPVHNAAGELPELLDSLVLQDYSGDWEVVVADNGSTDGSRDVVGERRDRLERLSLVDASSIPGGAHARNVGARASVGRRLLFVDADDVLDRSYVASMASALAHHHFVCGRHEVKTVNPPWTWVLRPAAQQDGPMMWTYDFLPYAGATSIGIHRDVFEAVGGFDESLLYTEDIDFCWRVQLQQGTRLAFAPDAVVHVRYQTSLRAMFSQARRWGRAEAGLYKRYQAVGAPRIPLLRSLQRWKVLPGRSLRHSAGRAYWATELGNRIGRIEGSVAHRTFML